MPTTVHVNPVEWIPVPPGRLILQALRSHDQYNATIYAWTTATAGLLGVAFIGIIMGIRLLKRARRDAQ